jgi:hypothetical protein
LIRCIATQPSLNSMMEKQLIKEARKHEIHNTHHA